MDRKQYTTTETRRAFLHNMLFVSAAGLGLTAAGGAITLANDFNQTNSSHFVPTEPDVSQNAASVSQNTSSVSQNSPLVALTNRCLPDGWYVIQDADKHALTWADDSINLTLTEPNGSDYQKWNIKWTDQNIILSNAQNNNISVLNVTDHAFLEVGSLETRWTPWVDDKGHVSLQTGDYAIGNLDDKAALCQLDAASNFKFPSTEAPAPTVAEEPEVKTPTEGWYTTNDNKLRCIDPSTHEPIKNVTRVDPITPDIGSIYDFDAEGNATWHLPTLDDLPNGAHGSDAAVPDITQGDLRQRAILYALSRVGCSYALGNQPYEFVCDGLTQWAYEHASGETTADASFQWALINDRNGNPANADISTLRPGDLVFFGDDSGKPLTYYAGAFGDYGYGNYHAGMVYANGKMINARGNPIGVTKETDIASYSTYNGTGDGGSGLGWVYLGGGSPYTTESCRTAVPTTFDC